MPDYTTLSQGGGALGVLGGLLGGAQMQSSPGILGNGPNDPKSAANMALAAGLIRGDLGGGLLGFAQQMGPEGQLQRAKLAEAQLNMLATKLSIDRQQAWLNMVSGGGQGGASAPQDPPGSIQSTGAFLPPPVDGVGPTAPVSMAPPSLTQSPQSGFALGLPGRTDAQSRLIAGMMTPEKYMETFATQTAPQTDIEKLLISQGAQRGSPLWNQTVQAGLAKATSLPPTRLGNAGYWNNQTNSFIPVPAQAPAGYINVPDATQESGYRTVQVGNGPAAVRTAAGAKTAGEGDVLPGPPTVDENGKPQPIKSRTQIATQNSGLAQNEDPNVQVTPQMRAGGDVVSLQNEIARVNKSMVPTTIKQQQLDILNAELKKAQTQAAQPAAAVQSQPGAPASGLSYSVPPLGTVTNADASQKASAESMKASYDRLQSTGTTANSALDALTKMQDLAAQKNPYTTVGPLGTHQSAVNPSAAEYEKQRANVIALMAQQLGAGGTDAGRANISESVPDFGKPKAAIADGLGTLQNQIVAQQIKRDFLTPVYQQGDSKKYTTLENQFDQNVSPALVPLLTMPAGPQRAAALKSAAMNPALKARLNWAAENGLLK